MKGTEGEALAAVPPNRTKKKNRQEVALKRKPANSYTLCFGINKKGFVRNKKDFDIISFLTKLYQGYPDTYLEARV